MAQPVKNIILSNHENVIKENPVKTLLVDGNSLLFMAFKDEKINNEGEHYGAIYQFLLQLKIMMQKTDYDFVYVFFDNEYSGYLRWEIYPHYKQNREKNYAEYGLSEYAKEVNLRVKKMQEYYFKKWEKKAKSEWDLFIDKNFIRERDILCSFFNELYIRWYIDEITEGDDLIAYYCKNKKDNEYVTIMSGDMDITQLVDDKISVYNLHDKKLVTKNNFKELFGYHHANVVVKKIMCGDVSDNIGHIKLLSETAFENLMPEYKDKPISVEDVINKAKGLIEERKSNKKKPLQLHTNIVDGVSNKEYDGDYYEINERLINLKKPLLSEEAVKEMDSMMYAPQDPSERSFGNLFNLVMEQGIVEWNNDTKFSSFFSTFKKLEEKEKKFYDNSLNCD